MENLENVKGSIIKNDHDPFYTEIASFSGDNIVRQYGIERAHQTNDVNYNFPVINSNFYKMRIKLFKNSGFISDLWNELILDGVGNNYNYVDGTARLDNRWFNPNLCLNGVLTSVYASGTDRTFELSLSKSRISEKFDAYENGVRSAGFKLSEIVSNIEKFDDLSESSNNLLADVSLKQQTYFVNRCFTRYVVFNFNLCNFGSGRAQKVLFKNVFSRCVCLDRSSIFINGNRLHSRFIDLDNNILLVRLKDLECNEHLNLSIVGRLFSSSLAINFSTVSYVSRVLRSPNGVNVDISQKISDVRIL